MSDGFSDYAETAIPRTIKKRLARLEARQAERLAEVREERGQLSKAYRLSRRAWMDDTAQNHPDIRDIKVFLSQMGPDDAEDLVEWVRTSEWISTLPGDAKLVALLLIDDRIQEIRRKMKLPEFNDPLPGEPDNAFIAIRKLLFGV